MSNQITNAPLGNSKSSQLVKAADTALQFGYNKFVQNQLPKNGQFGFKCILQTPTVILENSDFDMEFEIPFDDDVIANEAEVVVYNLSNSTAAKFKVGNTIWVTAGYGTDTGLIFSGYITKVITKRDGVDRVTTIYAVDDIKYNAMTMTEKTYAIGTKASDILKDLLSKLGLTIEVFKPQRDHTFDSETNVDGNIVENIKTYSDICGVSTYIHKQKIYSRPIWDGDNLHFNVNSGTGMIGSPEPFEEESNSEEYTDTLTGYEIEMLLQHRLATAGIIYVNSYNFSGDCRVISGTHSYNGLSATTKFKCMEKISTTIDVTKKEKAETGSVVNKAVSWALEIAKDDSHTYSQSVRWGPSYDCSSFVITAFEKAGLSLRKKGANATPNMYTPFIQSGFVDVTSSITLSSGKGLLKGDVLLNTKDHTALVRSNGGAIVHAAGRKKGIVTGSYYNYPWNYVLRYKGDD